MGAVTGSCLPACHSKARCAAEQRRREDGGPAGGPALPGGGCQAAASLLPRTRPFPCAPEIVLEQRQQGLVGVGHVTIGNLQARSGCVCALAPGLSLGCAVVCA